MINYTNIDDATLIELDPFQTSLDDAEIAGFNNPDNPNKMSGYTDLIAFFPELETAVHVFSSNPHWFSAISLEDAIKEATGESK